MTGILYDIITMLSLSAVCCMVPNLFRPSSRAPRDVPQSDTWHVTSGIQETYDQIVNFVDDWQEKALLNQPKGRFSLLSRNKGPNFVVDEARSPRLYRLKGQQRERLSFELTEIVGGGTLVAATYSSKSRDLIQDLKAKLPIIVPTASPNTCPSCGKEMMPDFQSCPYCGQPLQ